MTKLIKTIIALMLTANAAWATDDTKKTIVTSPDGKLKVCAESEKEATDYKHTKQDVDAGDKLDVHLASGGGWAAIITK